MYSNSGHGAQSQDEVRTCYDTELMTEQAQSPAYKILHKASFSNPTPVLSFWAPLTKRIIYP